jgi:hypothetical protein
MPSPITTILETDAATDLLRDALADHPRAKLQVSGNCMSPELRSGDTVTLVSSAARKPRWGDVVLVTCPEGIRLHRLVWNLPPLTLTKADRSRYLDGARTRKDILASVLEINRTDPFYRSGRCRRLCALQSLALGLLHWARLRAARMMGTSSS